MKILDLLSRVWLLNQAWLLKSGQGSLLTSLIHNEATLEGEDGRAAEIDLLSRIGAI